MVTREQLLKEHTEWTVKYVKADEHLKSLLPQVANVSEGEKLKPFIITQEWLAECARAEKDVSIALTKLQEIREKLSQLR